MSFFNRNKLSEDNFQLSLDDTELSLGEELKGTLSVKSEVEFDIEMIWVRLRCEESAGKENAILYDNDDLDLSEEIHVDAGFDKEFPFVVKLPSVGRETYHSIHQNVRWLIDAYIKVKGKKYAISAEGSGEILVAKPSASTTPVKEVKEIVREVVLIPCAYCSGLMPQTSIFCPNCGARRKA
jgi:hypothetical protein